MAPKRRKKRRVNNTANIDIEQIANDSVSNPSHLQQREERNKDESKGSKGSKPSEP